MAEDYISICNKFLQVLSEISKDENRDKERPEVLETLNCIRLDFDCHLKVRFAQHGGHGDKSWFYCYVGEHDSYVNAYEKRTKKSSSFFTCYNYDEIYNVFNHLLIEPSPMGAWQAYLMLIATHFLPTAWHGGYSKRSMIFTNDEYLKRINRVTYKKPKVIRNFEDLSPSVTFDGNNATVMCHYWSPWRGLVKESVPMTFIGGKAYFLDAEHRDVLVKYDCGIRF